MEERRLGFNYWYLLQVLTSCSGVLGLNAQTLVWTGGEFQVGCPLTLQLLIKAGQYVKENVVAVKAVSFKDDIIVLTPRFKRGVPATVSKLVRGRDGGPRFSAYPDLAYHQEGDCAAVQNAVDFYLDDLGLLWVLDSGTVDIMFNPRCTCPPKLLVFNLHHDKMTASLDLSDVVETNSVLREVAVEYDFGSKPFAYITDLFQSSVLVYDVNARTGYRLLLPLPPCRLQMALCKRAPAHRTVLLFSCRGSAGIYQIDTRGLRHGNSVGTVDEVGDKLYPVTFLGSDVKSHTIYLNVPSCSDVVGWHLDSICDASSFPVVHYSSQCCMKPTSVFVSPMDNEMLILESNFGDFIMNSVGTGVFHRLTITTDHVVNK